MIKYLAILFSFLTMGSVHASGFAVAESLYIAGSVQAMDYESSNYAYNHVNEEEVINYNLGFRFISWAAFELTYRQYEDSESAPPGSGFDTSAHVVTLDFSDIQASLRFFMLWDFVTIKGGFSYASANRKIIEVATDSEISVAGLDFDESLFVPYAGIGINIPLFNQFEVYADYNYYDHNDFTVATTEFGIRVYLKWRKGRSGLFF